MDTSHDFNLNTISDSINNSANQNDLPKYDDLAHSHLNLNNEIALNDSPDAIQIDLNEATTSVEPPKYGELKINNL